MVPLGKQHNLINLITTAASFAVYLLTLLLTNDASAATALHYII